MILDTAAIFGKYEASVRTERKLIDTVKPLPLKLSFVRISEVTFEESPADREKLKKTAEAALRQYAKSTLGEGEEILESSMDFYEMENVIKISIFAEVLEEIGEDKKIRIKK